MSCYPFKITDRHKTYKITFLQSVIIKMEYDSSNETFQKFSDFFSDVFKLPLTEQEFNLKNTDAIRLRSENKAYRVKFSKNCIEFVINGDAYVNFNTSALPFIRQFSDYLEITNSVVTDISIEKIDIWPLANGEIPSPSEFLNTVISENLRNSSEHISDDEAIVEYRDSDNGESLLIRFCFIPFKADIEGQPPRIVLDTLCSHENESIEPSLLAGIAKRLNDILYDAYHWSVTDEVVEIMNS